MKVKKHGIKLKLGIAVGLVTIIYVVSVATLFLNLTEAIQKRTRESYESMLDIYTSQLFSGFEEIDNFVNTLSTDFDVNMLAMQIPGTDAYELQLYAIRHNIFSYYFNYRILNGFYIYDSATEGVTFIPDDKGHYTEFVKICARQMDKKSGWYSYRFENDGDTIFVRAYKFGKTQWLFAIVNARNIAVEFEKIARENELSWDMEDDRGNILYGSHDIIENPQLRSRYDVVSEAMNYNTVALKMNFYMGYDVIWKQYRTYAFFSFMVFAAFTVLMVRFVLYTRKRMLQPLQILLNGMERFAGGDDQVHIDQVDLGEPEMQYALQSFNQMVEQIRENKFKIYESELERQKLLIQNVQSQINPHFFSNTTNLIYNLIEIGKIETAEQCLMLLSTYYRYMTTIGNDTTTLKHETDFVSSYMDIMKLRFPNKLSCEIKVDPRLENLRIPPLLIQPLAENCMKHGFTDRRKCFKVEICAYVLDDAAVIDVMDNGRGFPEKYQGTFDMTHPMPAFEQDSDDHVGMLNIYRRLMMQYEEHASMTIGRVEEQTLVRIQMNHWE